MDTVRGGTSAMDLGKARLCLDCEEIFEGKSRCPRCDSETWYPIIGWIRPMSEAKIKVVRKKADIFVLASPPQGELLTGTAL
jgi:RNA polymerase subunit RPABC4/transcription elongation factor Spt4